MRVSCFHLLYSLYFQITDLSAFLDWLNNTFIPVFYPEEDFAYNTLENVEKQWFGDHASIRVGPAQIRQLRVKKRNSKLNIFCK
jgi:hypothetical protein